MSSTEPETDEALEQYLSTNSVAEMFDVTNETVRNWIQSGKLRAGKLAGLWRVRKSEVIRFANEHFGES